MYYSRPWFEQVHYQTLLSGSEALVATFAFLTSLFKTASYLAVAIIQQSAKEKATTTDKEKAALEYANRLSGAFNVAQPFVIGVVNCILILIVFFGCWPGVYRDQTAQKKLIAFIRKSPTDIEKYIEGKSESPKKPKPDEAFFFVAAFGNISSSLLKLLGPFVTGCMLLADPGDKALKDTSAFLNVVSPFVILAMTRLLEIVAIGWFGRVLRDDKKLKQAMTNINSKYWDAEAFVERVLEGEWCCGKEEELEITDAELFRRESSKEWVAYDRARKKSEGEKNEGEAAKQAWAKASDYSRTASMRFAAASIAQDAAQHLSSQAFKEQTTAEDAWKEASKQANDSEPRPRFGQDNSRPPVDLDATREQIVSAAGRAVELATGIEFPVDPSSQPTSPRFSTAEEGDLENPPALKSREGTSGTSSKFTSATAGGKDD